jgi:RNA-directed DNA polymerase
MILKDFS